MSCDEAVDLIALFLDGELGAADVARLEHHVSQCEPCRAARAGEAWLHSVLAADALAEAPPDALRRSIREAVAAEARAARPSRALRWRRALLPAVIGGALAVAVAALLALRASGPAIMPALLSDSVVGHQHYAGSAAALDVHGDVRRLEQWLRLHLGLTVRLPAAAGDGQIPVGARVAALDGLPAAQVLYTGGGPSVSLFIARKPPRPLPEEGEHIVRGVEVYVSALGASTLGWWERGDHLYVAVSSDTKEHVLALASLCLRDDVPTSQPPAGS